jgi:DNA-binding SARP family transcriptional activator
VLLLAEPTQAEAYRVRAVLAHGGGLGVGAVLLGVWPSGTTCQLAIDATVTDATSGAGTDAHELVTTRLWSLTRGELCERLRVDLETNSGSLSQPYGPAAWGETAWDGPDLDESAVTEAHVGEPHNRDEGREGTGSYDRHNLSRDQHDRDANVEPETYDETFDDADDEVDEAKRGIRDEPGRGEIVLSDELDGADEPACSEDHERGERGLVPGSARLVVHCFGAFGLFARQDQTAPLVEITEIVPAKQRLLLRCLASRPDGVLADELLEVGWPDSPLAAARRRLHTTLTQLRRTLAGHTAASTATFAVLVGQRYHLTRPTAAPTAARPVVERTTDAGGAGGGAELVWVDWWAFQSALDAARAATGAARVPAWTRAARLYRGPLWPDECDISWVESLRYTASVEALGVLGQLAEHAERRGQREHAVAWLCTGLDHHPTDEPTVEALIRLYHRAGRPELAHRAYTALAARLAAAGLPGPDTTTTAALQEPATAHP